MRISNSFFLNIEKMVIFSKIEINYKWKINLTQNLAFIARIPSSFSFIDAYRNHIIWHWEKQRRPIFNGFRIFEYLLWDRIFSSVNKKTLRRFCECEKFFTCLIPCFTNKMAVHNTLILASFFFNLALIYEAVDKVANISKDYNCYLYISC